MQEIGNGLDECGVGAVCFDVDGRTLEGTCVEYCTGEWPDPVCEDPDTVCDIPGDVSFGVWCIEVCDPRQSDCGADEICVSVSSSGAFSCGPDFVGDGAGVAQPCDFFFSCEPGLACIETPLVPGCMEPGALGCCSSYCTVGDDSPCLPGQQCVPWFDDEVPHPIHEDLGVCEGPA